MDVCAPEFVCYNTSQAGQPVCPSANHNLSNPQT